MADGSDRSRLSEVWRRLRELRKYIADTDSPKLSDVDTLLSVAEGEVERNMGPNGQERGASADFHKDAAR